VRDEVIVALGNPGLAGGVQQGFDHGGAGWVADGGLETEVQAEFRCAVEHRGQLAAVVRDRPPDQEVVRTTERCGGG
jgi:hypothetical protein